MGLFAVNKFLCLLCAFLLLSDEPDAPAPARQIMDRMLISINRVQALKYNIKVYERVKGSIAISENNVKVAMNPFKVYLYNVAPSTGAEVLYVSGRNSGKALVKPNSFPYITLALDPYSPLLTKDNHHTINEMGFNYFADVISYGMKKNISDFNKIFQYKGTVSWEGKSYNVIQIEYPSFTYIPYTIKPGENIISIAREQRVSEYMIKEINGLKDYFFVKPGQVIKVPNAYAKRTVIYVDKSTYLPVMIAMYDDKGLYERYEYRKIIVNPQLAAGEFSEEYSAYNF